jgi:hypothetical protein
MFCYSPYGGATHFWPLPTVVLPVGSDYHITVSSSLLFSRSGCFRLPPVCISASKSIKEGFISHFTLRFGGRFVDHQFGVQDRKLILAEVLLGFNGCYTSYDGISHFWISLTVASKFGLSLHPIK